MIRAIAALAFAIAALPLAAQGGATPATPATPTTPAAPATPATPATPAAPATAAAAATPATPPSNPEKPVPPKAPKKTPELLEAGKKVYDVNCLPCHGEKGDGNGPVGQALVPKPRDFAKDAFKQGSKPVQVFTSISTGVKDTPMIGYTQLSEEERWAVTYHVLELLPKAKKGAKAKAKADANGDAKPDAAATPAAK